MLRKLKNSIIENGLIWGLGVIYAISLIPIFLLGRYAFPQADDWTFSYQTHIAWENTHSVFTVLGAAFHTVVNYYYEWQGTYFSIALMSLQPGMWKIEYYHFVPIILIGLLTIAIFMLFHSTACFLEIKGHDWQALSFMTLILLTQRMHSGVNAFYWYNGACHYVICTVVLIILVASILYIFSNRHKKAFSVVGCLAAFCLGGGNMITGLIGCVICATGVGHVLWKKKNRRFCLPIFLTNYIGFGINLLAPGNAERQDYTGDAMNPIKAIMQSFYHGLQYGFGKWFDWFFVVFIVFIIYIAYRMTKKIKFSFPLPGLFVGYSFCIFCAMFTPMEYAMQTVDVGRCLNAIYIVFVLLISIDIIYIMGWAQKKEILQNERIENLRYRKYWSISGIGVILFLCGIVAVIERDYFISELALREMVNGKAQEVATVAQENIEILQSEEMDVYLHPVPHTSLLLTSDDIDFWHFGTRLFFEKNTVTVIEEP